MKYTLSRFWGTAGPLGAALLCVQPATLAAENAFSGEGPFGGRASSVAFDPNDAQRAYALGFGSGMFFSDDGGTTWSVFNVDHPSIASGSISDFGIDPNNSSVLWVVDGGAEVARTTDRGVTWTVSTTGLAAPIYSVIIDRANSGTLFADSTAALYRSTCSHRATRQYLWHWVGTVRLNQQTAAKPGTSWPLRFH